MKNFLKGIGIGICIGIPLLAVLLIASHITGWPSFLHKNASMQEEFSQDSEVDESDFTGNTGIENNFYQESDSNSEDTRNNESGMAEDSTQVSEDADISTDEASGTGDVLLAFAGDVMFPEAYLDAYNRSGIQALADNNMLSHMQDADLFIFNEEFPFSSRGTQAPDKQYTFRLAPEKVSLFKEMGIDAVTLANNHALDYGTDALLDTCEILDQAGILHTGAGKDLDTAKQPVLFEKNGQRVALIGATRVIPKADWAATKGHPGMLSSYEVSVEPLLAQIAECHASGDKVVVLIHWGIERDEMPQEYQRALARRYIDAGADLVIGSHPHVLQGIEYYKGKPIFYSLGNFVFGSSIPKTMLVQAAFTGESLSLQLIPGTSSGGYTRMLTDAESKTQFYQYLEGISFGVSVGEDGIVSPQP